MIHRTHRTRPSSTKPAASGLERIAGNLSNAFRALRLQAKLSLTMWLEPFLRLILKPPTTTILDSPARPGQFPPIDALHAELQRLRAAEGLTPVAIEAARGLTAGRRRPGTPSSPPPLP